MEVTSLEEQIRGWFTPYTWDNGLALLGTMKENHRCHVRHYEGLIVCKCTTCTCELNITEHSVKAYVGVWLQFQWDSMAREEFIDPCWRCLYFAPDSGERLTQMYTTAADYLVCRERA